MKPPRSIFRNRPHAQPNYLPKVRALGQNLRRGTTHHVTVAHDDWCGYFQGTQCNCNPEVVLVPSPEAN